MHLGIQKIVPCLCFDKEAEEAVNFYVSVFANGRVAKVTRYGEKEIAALLRLPEEIRPGPAGSVKTVSFELFGQEFLAVNGGSHFRFSDAISLIVSCETQAEIDTLWDKLSAGGETLECGWLRDRYGLSWQVVPSVLGRMATDPDPEKSQRVMQAVFAMGKLDIATLERAYAGQGEG